MKTYTTLLFDADNTLFDFYAAERQAIRKTCEAFGVAYTDEVGRRYSDINDGFWKRFERREIEQSEIYVGRFRAFLEAVGAPADPEAVAARYREELSRGHMLIDGAAEICRELSKRYSLYIVTNGHAMVQRRRFDESGLAPYFKGCFISEEIGAHKPEKKFFDIVLAAIDEKDKHRVCVIGDSMTSDILGGVRAGLDTCFYNPKGSARRYEPTYEIDKLDELLTLF